MFGRRTGIVGLAIGRLRGRLVGPDAGRLRLCVIGVALAIALMIVLSGIALGLASQSTIQSEDVDYWITPEGGDTGSIVLPEDQASLGSVHEVTADLSADDRIDYASPVLIEPVRIVDPETGNDAYVIAVGVLPADDRTISEIPIGGLDRSYPYHNDGGYDGEWTGDTIVTDAAIEILGAENPQQLSAYGGGGEYELTVVDRSEATITSGAGDVPTIVLPLAELQTIVGVETADQADQILVSTTDPAVRGEIEGIYPGTNVVTRVGLAGDELTTSSLPLAMGVSSFVIAIAVGVLFVATMMGLELTSNRRFIATLDAIGYSNQSRSLLVFVETLTISAIGGIGGALLAAVGTPLLNRGIREWIGVEVVQFEPVLLAYGVAVALLIGVLAAPYPVWLSRKIDTIEVITG